MYDCSVGMMFHSVTVTVGSSQALRNIGAALLEPYRRDQLFGAGPFVEAIGRLEFESVEKQHVEAQSACGEAEVVASLPPPSPKALRLHQQQQLLAEEAARKAEQRLGRRLRPYCLPRFGLLGRIWTEACR